MNTERKGLGGWALILAVVVYMGFLILAPLLALVRGAFSEGVWPVLQSLTSEMLLDSFWLSVRIAFLVVLIQTGLGTLIAWVLVRQDFKGKFLINGLVDIPFMISPVVVGYMLLLLFGRNGLLFPFLDSRGIQVAFAVPGMLIATLFVSLPFMIREMIPGIANLDRQQELAAATLGANQWTVFWRIIFPQLRLALLYGITLTLARALGEFGAVLVVGGGVQGRTETTTLYIFRCLEERQYIEAYSAAILLGLFSVLVVSLTDRLKSKGDKTHTREVALEKIA